VNYFGILLKKETNTAGETAMMTPTLYVTTFSDGSISQVTQRHKQLPILLHESMIKDQKGWWGLENKNKWANRPSFITL
jgi:hypothetical protein